VDSSKKPDHLVGKKVRLLVGAPPPSLGSPSLVYTVRAVLTYINRESPEDVFYLEAENGDRSTALRRDLEFVNSPESK
jgi:hypothetical protein